MNIIVYYDIFLIFCLFLHISYKVDWKKKIFRNVIPTKFKRYCCEPGSPKIEGHFTLRLHSPYNNSLSLQALPSRWKLYKLGRDGILH